MRYASCLLVLLLMVQATATSGVEPQSANQNFDAEVALVRDAAHGRRLMLLGEKHATAEIPLLVASLVEEISVDQPVVLAIEIPRDGQAVVDDYLASDGDSAARAALRRWDGWQVPNDQHDGRRSEDLFDLLERMRAIAATDRDVSVLLFDTIPGSTRSHHERDRAMADYLREQFDRHSTARFVVLTGNVHAMRRKPSYAPPEMQEPMGAYLSDLNPYAINITARSGEFWGCREGKCVARKESTYRDSGPAPAGDAYDFHLVLPQFTVARVLGRQ
jgi:hypothetical protein